MTAPDVLSLVTVVMAAAVGIYAMIDARTAPGRKGTLRIVEAIACYYFVVIYVLALIDQGGYILRSGILTRMGVIVVLGILLAEIKISRNNHAARTA